MLTIIFNILFWLGNGCNSSLIWRSLKTKRVPTGIYDLVMCALLMQKCDSQRRRHALVRRCAVKSLYCKLFVCLFVCWWKSFIATHTHTRACDDWCAWFSRFFWLILKNTPERMWDISPRKTMHNFNITSHCVETLSNGQDERHNKCYFSFTSSFRMANKLEHIYWCG